MIQNGVGGTHGVGAGGVFISGFGAECRAMSIYPNFLGVVEVLDSSKGKDGWANGQEMRDGVRSCNYSRHWDRESIHVIGISFISYPRLPKGSQRHTRPGELISKSRHESE